MLLEDTDNMPVERGKRATLVMCNPDQTFFCINTTHYSPCQHVVLEDLPPPRGFVHWCGVKRCCRPGINSPCTNDCDDKPVIPVLVGESTERFESELPKRRIIVKAFLVDNDDQENGNGYLSGTGLILGDGYADDIEDCIYSDNYDINSVDFYGSNGPRSSSKPSYRTKCPALTKPISGRRAFLPSLGRNINPVLYTSPRGTTTSLRTETNLMEDATEISNTFAKATISLINNIIKNSEKSECSQNTFPFQESAMIVNSQITFKTTVQNSETTGYNELSSEAYNEIKTTLPINGRKEYNNAKVLKNITISLLNSTFNQTNVDSDEKNPIHVTNLTNKTSQKLKIPSPFSTQMYSAAMITSGSNEYTTHSSEEHGSKIDRLPLFPTNTPLCQKAGDFRYKISCTRYIHCSWNHGRLQYEIMRCPFYQEFDSRKKKCVPTGLSDCVPTSLSDQDVMDILGDEERHP
ncbi:uncharacterized protein [Anabrus simplex]